MKHKTLILLLFLYISILVNSGYPPTGDEVQAGSVLLPATRRGRYLANIVRRQAVDGTGIKFNKDADRMNAEAKKKVDVLSEELLPYIIAEQERRTTLYKRIMTAIQNGEKGVTIAELRNKPPLIIRKGLMYRCPANRAPKEPDGSGIIMCEEDIEPTPVMYDSCLSAEDKELYVAENKYFFCNRHKVEGPDLPRNGSTVIGCAPIERTSLNYTTNKCALEDTDDVLVHYRYYPDRTYKFVTELDPDREVCEHWNPCQIGYIYSLPSPDQATLANELWHDYRFDEYEKDEIIPSIPEDNPNEFVILNKFYTTSRRKWLIPEGYYYDGVGRFLPTGGQHRLTTFERNINKNLEVTQEIKGHYVYVTLTFRPFKSENAASYYLRFRSRKSRQKQKYPLFLTLNIATTGIQSKSMELLPSQSLNTTSIPLKCHRCILVGVMLRSRDGFVSDVDPSRYSLKVLTDSQGRQQKYIDIDLGGTKPQDFGDYFAIIQSEDGREERIKALTIVSPEMDVRNVLKAVRIKTSSKVGENYNRQVTFNCDECELVDVLCNGESVLSSGRITVVQGSKLISFNFPSFDDSNSCVYMGVFKKDNSTYRKILAVFENELVKINTPLIANSPDEGEQFEYEATYTCDDCTVDKVSVNGIILEMSGSRRANTAGSYAFYELTQSSIIIRINEFTSDYEGVYQAVFSTADGHVTKTILEIKNTSQKEEAPPETTAAVTETEPEGTTGSAADTGAASDVTTADTTADTSAATTTAGN